MTEDSKQGLRQLSLGALVISFIIVYCSQIFWPKLPSLETSAACVCCLAAFAFICKNAGLSLGALIGFIWSASVGYWYLHWQPQDIQFQQDIKIIGQITDVDIADEKIRLQLSAERIGEQSYFFQRRIRLNWYQPRMQIKVGDKVALNAKLKPIRGLANPDSFDYERWLLSNNIMASGYVVATSLEIIKPAKQTFRKRLIDRLTSFQFSQQRWLLSLTFGAREQLSLADWKMLQVSGLSHLFAISGLHLGILAGILWGLSYRISSLLTAIDFRLTYLQRAPQVNIKPVIVLLIVTICGGYAYLADWQIPVVRAWVMLLVALCLMLLRIRINLWQLIAIVFVVFILILPFSIYSNSFWLSIAAIALIAFYAWRWPSFRTAKNGYFTHYCKSLVRLQVLFSVLMMPLIVSQFGLVSIMALIINLIAVPFITALVVPLCLIAVALMLTNIPLDFYVFTLANSLLEFFIRHISDLVSLDWFVWRNLSISAASLITLTIGLLLAFFPRFKCQYRVVLLCVIPLITELLVNQSSVHDWQIHVLDVGQGTSVAITQGQSVTLVDTGAHLNTGFNMADAVVLPFLAGNKIEQIEHIIISHNDNDHAGSLSVIQDSLVVNNLIDPSNCQQGQVIEWKQLAIQILWPTASAKALDQLSENNMSCVVKISDGNRSVLLSGDIERQAEQYLVESLGQDNNLSLSADVLIAPHHGSKSSSSLLFLKHVNPIYSVYTTAYLNRWQFPHSDVKRRHQNLGIQQWDTGISGYLRFTIPYEPKSAISVESWRDHLNPRWYSRRMKD